MKTPRKEGRTHRLTCKRVWERSGRRVGFCGGTTVELVAACRVEVWLAGPFTGPSVELSGETKTPGAAGRPSTTVGTVLGRWNARAWPSRFYCDAKCIRVHRRREPGGPHAEVSSSRLPLPVLTCSHGALRVASPDAGQRERDRSEVWSRMVMYDGDVRWKYCLWSAAGLGAAKSCA